MEKSPRLPKKPLKLAEPAPSADAPQSETHDKLYQEREELRQIVERIDKLSRRPDNPGMAYRNLEMIQALMENLRARVLDETP